MVEVENSIKARGCPKINLQVRAANRYVISFYKAMDYLEDHVMSLEKRLEEDGSFNG